MVRGPETETETEPGHGTGRSMVGFLTLAERDEDVFEGPIPHYGDRETLFGGQVASQALRAASLTVEAGMHVSSMRSSYLRAGSRDTPLVLIVTRLREGRSFASRRVDAVQHGAIVLTLDATFHRPEEGPRRLAPARDVPRPESLPAAAAPSGGLPSVRMDIRTPDPLPIPETPGLALWARSLEPWPDEPALAACLCAYVSDMRTGYAALSGLGGPASGMITSLDHNLWFHDPIDPGDWLLVDMDPVANADARGLVVGRIHSLGGVHAATFAQEVLTRPARPPAG